MGGSRLRGSAYRSKCHISNLSFIAYTCWLDAGWEPGPMDDDRKESTLLPMLIAGLAMVIVGYIALMLFY